MYINLKYLQDPMFYNPAVVSLLCCLKGARQECRGRNPVVKFSSIMANGERDNLSFKEQ